MVYKHTDHFKRKPTIFFSFLDGKGGKACQIIKNYKDLTPGTKSAFWKKRIYIAYQIKLNFSESTLVLDCCQEELNN